MYLVSLHHDGEFVVVDKARTVSVRLGDESIDVDGESKLLHHMPQLVCADLARLVGVPSQGDECIHCGRRGASGDRDAQRVRPSGALQWSMLRAAGADLESAAI